MSALSGAFKTALEVASGASKPPKANEPPTSASLKTNALCFGPYFPLTAGWSDSCSGGKVQRVACRENAVGIQEVRVCL